MPKKPVGDHHFSKVAIETLVKTGTEAALIRARETIYGALWVVCQTVVESRELKDRPTTDKLREHWNGRWEAAKSILRHADTLKPTLDALYVLVPAKTVAEKNAVTAMETLLKKARFAPD
jgi:hypothetical protein